MWGLSGRFTYTASLAGATLITSAGLGTAAVALRTTLAGHLLGC
jgi:hypothetical protein